MSPDELRAAVDQSTLTEQGQPRIAAYPTRTEVANALRAWDEARHVVGRGGAMEAALLAASDSLRARIECAEDYVTRHYLDTEMGRRVLAILSGETNERENP